jgi:type IV pilus assembly protein PilM
MASMMASMGRQQMRPGGMMGDGMGGMPGAAAGGVNKKDYKWLTRTDFLLQFVWIPVQPEAQPKTPEEVSAKLKEIADKLVEAEKEYTADASTEKLEAAIEAESLKKSKAFDSAAEKALNAVSPAANAAPPPGGPNMPPPPAGVAPKGGNPPTK